MLLLAAAALLAPHDGAPAAQPRQTAPAPAVTVVAKEPGYYTSLAKHAVRWLASEGIAASLVTPDTMPSALAAAKIAYLVGFDKTTETEMAHFRAFRRRGGRLVVFYSSSHSLAALMDVKLLGYAKAPYPGRWSRMDFEVRFPEGCPRTIRQTSTVLQRAAPIAGKSRVMAVWSDRTGKSTGDAAWISGAAGFWMTHVLTADGDEALKARLLAAMAGSVQPSLWNAKAADARAAARAATLRNVALGQKPKAGEIRAVWDHSGCGLYPGDWPRTFRLLKARGATDLFVNVAGAGFAHYPSKILPRSKIFEEEGDQLAACLAAAAGSGVRVHAWILCFTAARSAPARLAEFRKLGWTLDARDGTKTEYLNPSNAALRKRLLDAISEIRAGYRVAGIHLDFVRWYEKSAKPADAAAAVSSFVAAARLRVARPVWLTAAVLGKYPSCVAAAGQDWTAWLDSGTIDYAVPMDYTEDLAKFKGFVAQHAEKRSRAARTIAGIGVTANESRLDAAAVMAQIAEARKAGLAGVALFDLDATLETSILPYLSLGAWRRTPPPERPKGRSGAARRPALP